MEYNRAQRKKTYTEILESSFNIIGEEDPAANLSSLMREFLTRINVPTAVKDLGISKAD